MKPSKEQAQQGSSRRRRKRLSEKQLSKLGKQIEAGDEAASFALMREACETENWLLLESCVREHNLSAPQSPRPYIYLAFAYAHLDRQQESDDLLKLGYERCPSASRYMKEMAVVCGTFGQHDQTQLYFAMHRLLASESGDDKASFTEFGKAYYAFLKDNGIQSDTEGTGKA
ncbi:hypothetical protein [Pelagicoccus sp. SDUM812005]|uniref:hypothetical protein n=1 Tax=Pelagicoccus sp. SDUM812005 TaxID=3041257 RepID=UPI00280F560E|nr:hypothetical protein [Pelagicoccus sp. SDUM812005]MDQ8182204.1 hypothetical protein [Pelagicoccus sp. SDUM812005]